MTSIERQHPIEEPTTGDDINNITSSSPQTGALGSRMPLDACTGVEGTVHCAFPFLQLPPEIRNRIYHLVFVKPGYIGSEGTLTKAFYHDAAKWRNLAFARSCRQIHNESADIFYARNGFEFFYIRPFLEFIEAIGIKRRKLLTKLRFHHTKGTPFIALRYLKSCNNLEELDIRAKCLKRRTKSWWEYPMKNAKSFFLGSRSSIEFGDVLRFGKGITHYEHPAEGMQQATLLLVQSLLKVKAEENGKYKRPDLPNVFANGHCAWEH